MSTLTYLQHDEWYRLVAQHVTDVVLLVDADDRSLWVSPSIHEVLGWSPDQVLGRETDLFVSPETHGRVAQERSRAGAGVAGLEEIQVRCADGRWKWMSHRSVGVVLPDHSEGRVVSLRDMDEAVRARQAAAASEIRFRTIAEHASDLVCMADPERRLLWVSPNVVHVLGWEPEELLGRTLSDFAHPDDREENLRHVAGLYRSDGPADGVTIFGRLRRKDGDYRWMSGLAKPLLDAEGRRIGVAAGLRNVTELVELRASAESAATMLRAVMDSARDPIILFGPDHRIEYVNPEVERQTDWAEDRWLGNSPTELAYEGAAATAFEEQLRAVFDDGTPRLFEFLLDHGDGRTQWFEANLAPVLGADGAVEHVVSSYRDVTERHRTEEALVLRATRDELTGLSNRTTVMTELVRSLASSSRTGRATAVLMVDLDHFKQVNDSLGHAVGDELLIAAAHRLGSLVRGGDLPGRLGGDEFVVVMRDLAGIDDVLQLADRIVEAFRAPFHPAGTAVYATASIGIAYAADAEPHDLLREADTALYVAKQGGRSRHAVFTDALRESISTKAAIGGQLRPAFERGEFEVLYQPELDLATGEVVALEALLRWNHRSGEQHSAAEFIHVADETGLLAEIGAWVLFRACHDAARWQHGDGRGVTVRVNLSANQLAEPELLTVLDAALTASGLDPSLLCLEVTESALLRDDPAAHEHLAAARDRGVRVSIDDFGTGYSSLAYLRDLPVDVLKIDRDLIARIHDDERDRRIVAGIVALAEQLEIPVTAEGVESGEQVDVLRRIRCRSAQGHHLAPPLSADDVPSHLRRSAG